MLQNILVYPVSAQFQNRIQPPDYHYIATGVNKPDYFIEDFVIQHVHQQQELQQQPQQQLQQQPQQLQQ